MTVRMTWFHGHVVARGPILPALSLDFRAQTASWLIPSLLDGLLRFCKRANIMAKISSELVNSQTYFLPWKYSSSTGRIFISVRIGVTTVSPNLSQVLCILTVLSNSCTISPVRSVVVARELSVVVPVLGLSSVVGVPFVVLFLTTNNGQCFLGPVRHNGLQ